MTMVEKTSNVGIYIQKQHGFRHVEYVFVVWLLFFGGESSHVTPIEGTRMKTLLRAMKP